MGYLITLKPTPSPTSTSGIQVHYMLTGKVRYRHADRSYVLEPGDAQRSLAGRHGPEKNDQAPMTYRRSCLSAGAADCRNRRPARSWEPLSVPILSQSSGLHRIFSNPAWCLAPLRQVPAVAVPFVVLQRGTRNEFAESSFIVELSPSARSIEQIEGRRLASYGVAVGVHVDVKPFAISVRCRPDPPR